MLDIKNKVVFVDHKMSVIHFNYKNFIKVVYFNLFEVLLVFNNHLDIQLKDKISVNRKIENKNSIKN